MIRIIMIMFVVSGNGPRSWVASGERGCESETKVAAGQATIVLAESEAALVPFYSGPWSDAARA